MRQATGVDRCIKGVDGCIKGVEQTFYHVEIVAPFIYREIITQKILKIL